MEQEIDNFKRLFGNGVHGVRVYEIWSKGNTIVIYANGSHYYEEIKEGKAGRTISEQIKLRINARLRSKLDQGFKRTKEELGYHDTNQLGLLRPMLAKPFKNVRDLTLNGMYIQPKLDGHRCLMVKQEGKVIAYSRAGKIIDTLDHITHDMDMPENVVFDGELYCHGQSLQTIASWSKRLQPNTKRIKYHIYDCIVEDDFNVIFGVRFELLQRLHMWNDRISLVETIKHDPDRGITINDYYRAARDEGYEGAILRPANGIYAVGKRPDALIKVKMREEDEFTVLDVVPTRDGWGNLVLKSKSGLRFKTLAPGTVVDKIFTLNHKDQFIGRTVTCEYANLTDSGKPQHCVAMRYRVDI